MNKKFLILLLVPILATLFFIANKTIADDEISQDKIKKIEKETQACLDKGIAMQNCNYEAIDKYEIEIEKALKKLKSKLTQSQYEKLSISQEKWEKFASTNYELYSEIYDTIPATIVNLFGSKYKKEIFENRAKELVELYNEYIMLLKEYDANKYYQ